MAIQVTRNGRTLWPECETAFTLLRKMRGIAFKSRFAPLLFDFGTEGTARNAIHSFFCAPFDAVFLDSAKKVVDVIPDVRPWRPWIVSKKSARYLIEAPAGDARRLGVKEGDSLEWIQ
ncbi:MAG: DUF192 domain-containing protein [Candidatus Micrarchaeota archaeon]